MSVIKTFSEFINESIWSDESDTKKVITTNRDLRKKIQELYKEQGEGDTLDVSSLTNAIKCDDFAYIFQGYENVKHIIGLEDWDVSEVTNMNGMFIGCAKLKEIKMIGCSQTTIDKIKAQLTKSNITGVTIVTE